MLFAGDDVEGWQYKDFRELQALSDWMREWSAGVGVPLAETWEGRERGRWQVNEREIMLIIMVRRTVQNLTSVYVPHKTESEINSIGSILDIIGKDTRIYRFILNFLRYKLLTL